MRVLHAGNFGTRGKGAALNSIAPKLSRGLVRAGHAVVDFDDRDAVRAWGGRALGIVGANRALARLAHAVQPHLLLLGHADTLRPDTLAALRRSMPAMRVLQWNVDPLFEPGNLARLRAKLPHVDATLVSTAGDALAPLRRDGMRLGFFPNPVDFSVETGAAHSDPAPPFDLFYACGHPARPKRHLCGRDWDMDDFLQALRRAVPGLTTCLAGVGGAPHLAGAAYQATLGQCAAGLNASRRNDFLLYSSDRLAQMVGSGQLALVERGTGYPTLFSNAEMGFFSSFEELVALLRRVRAEPAWRMAVAAAGRARYHALFNETRVAGYVLDVAFDRHDPEKYEWPTLLA